MERLIIATKNRKKFAEISKILEDVPVEIECLADFEDAPEIIESGNTFFENAAIKAKVVSKFYNCWALGEDSGLEVFALDNQPGIYSARFAGEDADDRRNIAKLLELMKDILKEKRGAQFRCCAVLANHDKVVERFDGVMKGLISFRPMGEFGFGYDPVFYIPGLKKTLAQIPPEEKNKISHRYKALTTVKNYLLKE